jgi:hypothetical protein
MHDSKLIFCFLVDIAFPFDNRILEWNCINFSTLRTNFNALSGNLSLVNDRMFKFLLFVRDGGRNVRDTIDILNSAMVNLNVVILRADRT